MIIKSLEECLAEVASAGATSAGNVAVVSATTRERSSAKRRKQQKRRTNQSDNT